MPKQKPRADGRYCRKYHGKCFYSSVSDDDARRQRDDYKYRCEHGIDEIRNITVSDYVDEWLPVAKAAVSDKCYNDYAVQLDALKTVCGDKYMNAVLPLDIKKVWAHYLGYSDSTIKRARMLYRSLFSSAIENGYCRRNPMDTEDAKPHKGTSGSHRAIEPWERDIILTFPHRMQAPAMLMLYAGLRRGEMLAFTDQDIIFEVNRKTKKKVPVTISVSEAVRFESNQAKLTDPKTSAGKRLIPVFEALAPFLQDLSGYILKNEKGKICSETAFRNAWTDWKNQIELMLNNCKQKRWYFLAPEYRQRDPRRYDQIRALLAKGKKEEADALRFMDWKPWTVRPHDLRHSFCVMLRDAGVDMKLAIQWMGHADEKMILKIYDHVSDLRIRNAINSVNSLNTERASNGRQKNRRTALRA